jgi:chromosome segregation ATPase
MVSVAEFEGIQIRLIEIEQSNYQLRDRLQQLTKAEPDLEAELRRVEEECQALETTRVEIQTRHSQSLDALKQELERLRREADENTKRSATRASDINVEIAELGQHAKEKEEAIDRLKSKIKVHDAVFQKKTSKLQSMIRREQCFRPHVDFLRVSRGIPMYLEDLSSRIAMLLVRKTEREAVLRDLAARTAELRQARGEVKGRIRGRAAEVAGRVDQAKGASARLENAQREIERTERAVAEANQRLALARDQTRRLIEERADSERELATVREKYTAEIAQFEREEALFERQIDEIRESRQSEVDAYNERIQALRKKVTFIRDNDEDPDRPRVDVDLQKQIEKIRADKAELIRETARVEEQTKRLDVQVQQKTWDLQTAAMKMQPTQEIMKMPQFQEKSVLLKELVLQNKDLRVEVTKWSEKLITLKQENNEIRRQLEKKSII